MRITIEIDDDEIRRVLAPLVERTPTLQQPQAGRLLRVKEVAERLGISRQKVYELLNMGEIKSLAIGRSRRISPVEVAEFIARPQEDDSTSFVQPSFKRDFAPSYPKKSEAALRKPTRRTPRSKAVIDLTPTKRHPQFSGPPLSGDELERVLTSMLEKGWPADVIAQIRDDERTGLVRTPTLTINEAATYLGLSRYGVEKLINDGKLRMFTEAPMYRDEKPKQRIPAKDILALQ
jgi:excisionase family DNA binding protein